MPLNAPDVERASSASISPSTDCEAFEYLVQRKDCPSEVDYIAYAIFAHRRKSWCDHFETRMGRRPSSQEIDNWIRELAPFEYREIRNAAATFFKRAAMEYMREDVELQKAAAVDASILNEVRSLGSPWRHLPIALIMALAAPIILGLIVFLIGMFDENFPIHIIFGGSH